MKELIDDTKTTLLDEALITEISLMKVGSLVILRKFLNQIKMIDDTEMRESLRLLSFLVYASSLQTSNTSRRGKNR